MHWFWRGAIAAGVGVVLSTCQFHASNPLRGLWCYGAQMDAIGFLSAYVSASSLRYSTACAIVLCVPGIVLSFAVYGLLTRRYYRDGQADSETRCRKCHYILKGITEPRCPECGERI